MVARLTLETLQAEARAVGLAHVGVVTPTASGHMPFYRSWLERGHHGDMGYLARPDAVRRRAELEQTLAGVRSVVVVADAYPADDPAGVPADPARGVVARYARGRDYHRVLEKKLRALGRRLEDGAGGGRAWRAYVDTGPILERDLGRRAGLGWHGKNTMLIHPRRGSYFFLGVLLTDAALPTSEPFTEDHCGTCRACLDACPTGALLGRDPGGAPVMDARLCISYLTIEQRGPIPESLRPAMGNRIFGCDICQEVCPWNEKFAEPAAEPDYAARPGMDGPLLLELAALLSRWSDEEFREAFAGSAVRRAGREGLLRNVCVALGNWAHADALPALEVALGDDSALVREHAAWARGRIE